MERGSDGLTGMVPVWFVLTPQVLMLDYTGPAEALRMAADAGAPFALHHCAAAPALSTSLGVRLTGLQPLPRRLPPDSLVIVTGTSDPPSAPFGREAQAVIRWLATVPRPDTTIASICSGALLLAQAGLLTGRRCTTHHSLIEALKAAAPGAQVQDDCLFVDDGSILTSAGITAGIDLALHLIERHAGAEMAGQVARRQVIYQRREGSAAQRSPWLAHRNHMHPAVHRAQDAVARDPARNWSLMALAADVHVSARHLSRLFAEHAGVTVAAYQQSLRIARARQLLADTRLTIEAVAEQAGFASARDFRRVWRLHAEGPPRAVRESDGHARRARG